jgi:hypothetical protein
MENPNISPLDLAVEPETLVDGEFKISEPIVRYWREIAGWCYVFSGTILLLTILLYSWARLLVAGVLSSLGLPELFVPAFVVPFFLFAYYYFRAGQKIRHAFEFENNRSLEAGFKYLKRAYIMAGVVSLIYGFFYIIYNLFLREHYYTL